MSEYVIARPCEQCCESMLTLGMVCPDCGRVQVGSQMNEQLRAYAHLTGEPVPDKPEEGYDMTQFGHWDPPDDILSAERVAEMREHQLGRDARADEDIIDLCDTVDDLRAKVEEAQQEHEDRMTPEQVYWLQRLRGERDALREQLRKLEKDLPTEAELDEAHNIIRYRDNQIRRLTDALRDAKPALLRVVKDYVSLCTIADAHGVVLNPTTREEAKADAAALRALAEMEGENDE